MKLLKQKSETVTHGTQYEVKVMALAAGAGTTKAALLGKHIVPRRPKICSNQVQATLGREASEAESFRRRDLLSSAAMLGSTLITSETPVQAVQGSVPGRIPGLSETVDEEGFRWYVRPEGKQGNHGIGWSELPQYGFRVPDGWKEIPVSIADPGGAEIDMRMRSDREGDLSVVVAPVKRFIEPPEDRPLTIEEIGSPEKARWLIFRVAIAWLRA